MNYSSPFYLVGQDSEGGSREASHATLEAAVEMGESVLRLDKHGPPWKWYAVWGCHPETENWQVLVCSL